MSILKEVFQHLAEQGRTAFMPYITAGDPDAATSWRLLEILADQGADVVELGVPFTDPLADGPDNQKAAMRALRRPVGLVDTLRLAEKAKRQLGLPIVLFSYYNSIYSYGLDKFRNICRQGYLAGLVVPDLPFEESAPLKKVLTGSGVDLVQFISPTTPAGRRRKIAAAAQGFIYYVSLTGVTGRRQALAVGLRRQVEEIRRIAGLPVAVGFGISNPAHAGRVACFADGVIVGSALVSLVEKFGRGKKLYNAFSALAGRMARAVHGARNSELPVSPKF